jgi:GT2 family glycosyltransferase
VEIIVSANGCTDNTREYIEGLNSCKLVWQDNPSGFSKAINDGILVSKGEYVVLLNNDVVLLPQAVNQWLVTLLQPFRRKTGKWLDMSLQSFEVDTQTGITGPVLALSGPAQRNFIGFFCAMISRRVINKIGLLDEIFGPGTGEDTDFCIRAEDIGYKLVQVGNIGGFPISHVEQATMLDENCVKNFDKILERNSHILIERYRHG